MILLQIYVCGVLRQQIIFDVLLATEKRYIDNVQKVPDSETFILRKNFIFEKLYKFIKRLYQYHHKFRTQGVKSTSHRC